MIHIMNKGLLCALALSTLISCEKEEGVGGTASIKGKVVEQNLNCYLEKVGSSKLVLDKDVFIMYGDNTVVDDKIETSPSGEFSFDYLMPGKYTIYTYSDDTSNFNNSEKIVISKIITIGDKDEVINIDSINTYKHVEVNDGSAQACGFVGQVEYLNGTTIAVDTISAQDVDVYLMYGDTTFYDMKTKTYFDGSFCFNNLIPGKYKLYVLSEKAFSKEDIPKFQEFEILESTSTLQINPVYIDNF